jgi:exosome complex component RRP42
MFPEVPYPDMPDEGSISVNAELLAMASPDYESGPPSEDSIELARVVDRGIRESKCLDFKKFCIVSGEKVWVVYIELNVLNYDGNLFDAASLAAVAALKEAKVPKLDDEHNIVKGEYSGKLKLERIPMMTTYAKIGNSIVVDADEAEEKAMNARFSISTTNDGYICAFQKGLSGSFTVDELKKCVDDAFKHGSELAKHLR